MKLKNSDIMAEKTVVISGAGRGIGRATALLFAEAGAKVVLNARTRPELEAVAEQIRSTHGQATIFCGDVSSWADMKMLGEMVQDRFGAADIVVANAGRLGPVGNSWTLEPEAWQENIQVNLTGSFFLARACLPPMVARNSGVLVLVSSGVAARAQPGWSAYSAAKAGIDHLVRNLAAEFAQQDLQLRVHGLHPGVVDTDMQAEIRATPPETFPQVEKYERYQAQGQLRPPEVPAALILWLASEYAADLNGEVVSIRNDTIRERLAANFHIAPFADRR